MAVTSRGDVLRPSSLTTDLPPGSVLGTKILRQCEFGQELCVLRSPPGDLEAASSLRTTGLERRAGRGQFANLFLQS